jgi:hypothetical protein
MTALFSTRRAWRPLRRVWRLGTITYVADGRARTVEGELIAISPDTVWLLRPAALAIPAGQVTRAEVTGFNSRPGYVIALAAAGSLGTVSNGYFLFFTAPAWMIGNGRRYLRKNPSHSCCADSLRTSICCLAPRSRADRHWYALDSGPSCLTRPLLSTLPLRRSSVSR